MGGTFFLLSKIMGGNKCIVVYYNSRSALQSVLKLKVLTLLEEMAKLLPLNSDEHPEMKFIYEILT